ncbi:MAG: prolyl oligopeptidase family serine peptidase [Thermomicrobiales bacterium]
MAVERDLAPSPSPESPAEASPMGAEPLPGANGAVTAPEAGGMPGGDDRDRVRPDAPNSPGPLSVSPDGATLAYLVREGAGFRLELCPVGGGVPVVLDLPFSPLPDGAAEGEPGTGEGPAWSPDGRRLAVKGDHPGHGGSAIWLVEVETGESRVLVDHRAADRGPRWSPDGALVAFTSRPEGRADTVSMAFADEPGPAIALTDGRQDDRDPAWSFDGSLLAFRRRHGEVFGDHDLWVSVLATGELRQLTGKPGKAGLGGKPANRWDLRWAPDRLQMAYVSDEREWDIIAVINGENGAGWTLAGEAGDKADPRWDPTGKKILYVRGQGTTTACCVKGTSAATAVVLDPGDGVAASPRWLGEGRVVYRFGDPRRAATLVVQDAIEGAARTALPAPEGSIPAGAEPIVVGEDAADAGTSSTTGATGADSGAAPNPVDHDAPDVAESSTPAPTGASSKEGAAPEGGDVPATDAGLGLPDPIEGYVTPGSFAVEVDEGVTLSGLTYRQPERSGPAPAVICLGDGPPRRHGSEVQPLEQGLAAAGLWVYAPNGRGVAGYGRSVSDTQAALADQEVEIGDLVTIAAAVRAHEGVIDQAPAVVGRGYGGTLALLAAGRPGLARAYVAIDPVADWDQELDEAGPAWRAWVTEHLGVPAVQRGRVATHTPTTYAGLLDGPVLLLGTGHASPGRAAQLRGFAALLDELGVTYEMEEVPAGEPAAAIAARVAEFLRVALTPDPPAEPTPEPEPEPEPAFGDGADDAGTTGDTGQVDGTAGDEASEPARG